MHFKYTTHQFKDSKEPKRELAKYIPEYEENMNVSEFLQPRLKEAEKNVEKLILHFESLDIKWGSIDCNPMTDVTEILKELDVV